MPYQTENEYVEVKKARKVGEDKEHSESVPLHLLRALANRLFFGIKIEDRHESDVEEAEYDVIVQKGEVRYWGQNINQHELIGDDSKPKRGGHLETSL